MSDTGNEILPIPCTSTFDLPGYHIERQIGLCWGVVVRSVGFAKGFTGSIRALPRVRSTSTHRCSRRPGVTPSIA